MGSKQSRNFPCAIVNTRLPVRGALAVTGCETLGIPGGRELFYLRTAADSVIFGVVVPLGNPGLDRPQRVAIFCPL